jgi:hypothetical protein
MRAQSAEKIAGMPARPTPPPPPSPFTLSPGQQRFDPSGKPIANVPAIEKPDTSLSEVELFMKDPGAFERLLEEKKKFAPPIAAPRIDPLSPEGIKARLNFENQKPKPAASKPATGAQQKALGFYQRVEGAMKNIDADEPEIAKMGLGGQLRRDLAPNLLQAPVSRRFNQARDDFINASLRRESGAAISDAEYARFNKIYFPVPGDDKATLAQKKRSREIQLQSLKTEAGKAYDDFYGEQGAPSGGGQWKILP